MRATIMYRAGDVRIENVPDLPLSIRPCRARHPRLHLRQRPLAISGNGVSDAGRRMGHEAIGIVEAIGPEGPPAQKEAISSSCPSCSPLTCAFCHEDLHTLVHPRRVLFLIYSRSPPGGARPQADGTLFVLPVGEDDALMPPSSHAFGRDGDRPSRRRLCQSRSRKDRRRGRRRRGGLCGVIAAKRLGAERIMIVGRHPDRICVAREFGATDIVSERCASRPCARPSSAGGFWFHFFERARPRAGDGAGDRTVCRGGAVGGRVGVPQDPPCFTFSVLQQHYP